MGRIKTTIIKRTAKQLVEKSSESFEKNFEANKKKLGSTMPSKRMRNMIAGYITRIKKNTHKIIKEDKENE